MLSILDFFPESLAVHNFSNMFYQLSLSFCPEPGSFHVLSAKFVNFLEARFFSTEAEPLLCSFAAFSAGETQIWPGDCVSSLLSGLCLSFFLHGSASFFEAKVFHTFCTPLLSLSGPSLRAIGRNRGKKCIFP